MVMVMCPTIKEYTFFAGIHGLLANTDPSLNLRARFIQYQRTNVLQAMFQFCAMKSTVGNLGVKKKAQFGSLNTHFKTEDNILTKTGHTGALRGDGSAECQRSWGPGGGVWGESYSFKCKKQKWKRQN